MVVQSAGILVFRRHGNTVEVLLGHPGGPYWAKKDAGAWSIPKGEIGDDEDLMTAAKREFAEELGTSVPDGEYIELGSFKRSGGKLIHAWAVEGDLETGSIVSNTVQIEWPPKSGKILQVPEIDRAAWVPLESAPFKMHKGQDVFIRRLAEKLHMELVEPPEQQTLL